MQYESLIPNERSAAFPSIRLHRQGDSIGHLHGECRDAVDQAEKRSGESDWEFLAVIRTSPETNPFRDYLPPGQFILLHRPEMEDWGYDSTSKDCWSLTFQPETDEQSRVERNDNSVDLCIAPSGDDSSNSQEPAHYLGGEPQWIQLDSRPMMTLASNLFGVNEVTRSILEECGIDPLQLASSPQHHIDAARKLDANNIDPSRFHPVVSEWRLLFQIDSDESTGLNWGDAGRLFVFIPESSLVERDFAKAWCWIQSH